MEIHTIDSFWAYFDRVRGRTLAVAQTVTPEVLEWRRAPGTFSFGDILRHLGALERYMFAENACGRPSRYPGHGEELAAGRDQVLAFLARMHEETRELLSPLSPEELQDKCVTPGGHPITVWKWLRAMVEHEAHHRGQLYILLSLRGLSGPPIFGLTSEEVADRSLPPL